MLNHFLFSISAMLPMMILVFMGIYLRKIGFINKVFLGNANRIVFYVSIPALIFRSIFNSDLTQMLDAEFALFVALYSIAAFFVIWVFTYMALRKKAPGVISAFVQGGYRGNIAIVALPLLFTLIGEENAAKGVLATAVLIPVYNITSIVLLITHSEKISKISPKVLFWGILKNPPIIATIAGLVAAFSNLQLPAFAENTVSYFANLTTPLALLCLGGGMTFEGFSDRFRYSVISGIIKVLLLPLGAGVLAYWYGFRGYDLVIITVIHGVPSALAGYVMISEIGGDLYVSATNILATTIMSAFSLTLLIFILRTLGMIV